MRTKNLITAPKSRFVVVLCKKCKNHQVIYNKAATRVLCTNCNEVLAIPRGGVAEIKGKVMQTLS